MLHKPPKENMYLKLPSGIGRGRGKRKVAGMSKVKEAAKIGEMPMAITANWGEPRIKAYEIIDQNYAMPNQEYLSKLGFDTGLYLKKRMEDGTEYLSMRVSLLNTSIPDKAIAVPLGSSETAINGAVKFELYHMLRLAGELDKMKFKRSS